MVPLNTSGLRGGQLYRPTTRPASQPFVRTRCDAHSRASFFFGVCIWLVKVLGRFSINYFRGLGLRIRVRVWVRVWVRVRVRVRVGVRVSVVIWSG